METCRCKAVRRWVPSLLFIERQNALTVELKEIKKRRNQLLDNNGFENEIEGTLQLLGIIRCNPEILEEYDENIFMDTVEKIIIGKDSAIIFRLINTLELTEHRRK